MRLRKMTKNDLPQYRELHRHAFGMTAEHTAVYGRSKKEYDHAFGVFDGKKLAAGMFYYPFEMRVSAGYLPMGGVSMVATWPEYRKLGLAKKMMIAAQEEMKKTGRCLSILFPFKYSFYDRMGYGLACELCICEFDPIKLRRFAPEGYRLVEVDGRKHWRVFEDLHQRFRLHYNGTVKRDAAYWQTRYFERVQLRVHPYLVYRGKTHRGFVITALKEPQEYPKSQMSIIEYAWTEPAAAQAIFGFLENHKEQMKTIRMMTPRDLDLFPYFIDPRIEVKLHPKMMIKLVDAAAAIEKRTYPGLHHGRLGINLLGEETAPWNTGRYELSFDDERAEVTKLPKRRPSRAMVKISIRSLSQLYMGYYSVGELAAMNAITGPEGALEILAQAFPKTPTYIHDWF